MHLEILVEEPSAEAALVLLLPRILGQTVTFRIHPHQGKRDLLTSLPGKLRGYSRWLTSDVRIVVLVDLDSDECRSVKRDLERAAREAKLSTKTSVGRRGSFQVLNRIAIEELEAWFFGDVDAICSAFPRFPRRLASERDFRNPDRIHGTWERLGQELAKVGYYRGGFPKIEVARQIARHMDPNRNRSRSFCVFRDGLRSMLAETR